MSEAGGKYRWSGSDEGLFFAPLLAVIAVTYTAWHQWLFPTVLGFVFLVWLATIQYRVHRSLHTDDDPEIRTDGGVDEGGSGRSDDEEIQVTGATTRPCPGCGEPTVWLTGRCDDCVRKAKEESS